MSKQQQTEEIPAEVRGQLTQLGLRERENYCGHDITREWVDASGHCTGCTREVHEQWIPALVAAYRLGHQQGRLRLTSDTGDTRRGAIPQE